MQLSKRRKAYYRLCRDREWYKEKHLGYEINANGHLFYLEDGKITHGGTGLLVCSENEFDELASGNEMYNAIAGIEEDIKFGKFPKLEDVPLKVN